MYTVRTGNSNERILEMLKVTKTVWVGKDKIAPRFQEDLPTSWRWEENRAVREVEILEYDEDDISDAQIRSDANNGFDLRQRAENDWRSEVMDKKLSKFEKILAAISHAHAAEETELAGQMAGDKAGALAYFEENLA